MSRVLGILGVASLLLSTGCSRNEALAREHLRGEGLDGIELHRHESNDGSFAYTAGRNGDRCTGRILVARGSGSTAINDRMTCRPPASACTPEAPQACYRLGLLHDHGDDGVLDPTPPNATLAADYYGRACDGGLGVACNLLGLRRTEGRGVAVDLAEAARLFARSCQAGHGRGCYNLALSLHHGRGIAPNMVRAAELYAEACEQGVASACYNLGVCQRDGLGLPPSPPRAAEAFARACAGEQLQGCVNLGVMLTLGEGVAEDHPRAADLFRRACNGGLSAACDGLAELEKLR